MGTGKFKNLQFKNTSEEGTQVAAVGEVDVTQDFIPDTQPVVVLEAEELPVDCNEIRKRTVEIKENINKNYTELCKNLWLIQKKQLFHEWGYPSFREYASKELDFKGTKALYLASIWNNLSVDQDEQIFEQVMALGWSKGKELARVVTRENLGDWLEKGKHLGVEALVKEVREFIKKKIPDAPADALAQEQNVQGTPVAQETKTISLTFNYEDYLTISQAYEYMKTEDPNVSLAQALAMACRDFLGGFTPKEEFNESTIMEEAVESALPAEV